MIHINLDPVAGRFVQYGISISEHRSEILKRLVIPCDKELAVGYSLQAIGQKGLNPAVASLAMCMESVFSVIGGIFILHEIPSAREAFGCVLMFASIVLAELPKPERKQVRTDDSRGTD